jgi:SAM-dependent methyltransferase
MPEPLADALAEIRAALLDPSGLRRAVAAGRRRGLTPAPVRAELRPVTLKRGNGLQVVTSDGVRPATRNLTWGAEAESAVDELLAQPYGNWHVETATGTVQVRVTKKGEAQVHRSSVVAPALPDAHDREPDHLLDPGDPLFDVIGGSAAKRRQVDAFLRALESTVDAPVTDVVDLGCGNAYLTFAAYRYLSGRWPDVRVTGVDVREDQRERNTVLAKDLGYVNLTFTTGSIVDAPVDRADLVLALHACDTATDEALARAVRWQARYVLAAPCCHHDIAAQLKELGAPSPYRTMLRQPILRERFADVLTDGVRAALLRLYGYRVDVVEFVESRHTPRNVLLRARRTGTPPTPEQRAEYAALVEAWGVTPALENLLGYCR